MKKIVLIILATAFSFSVQLQAQSQHATTGTAWVGKTYTEQIFGVNNHSYVRLADMKLRQFDFEGAFFALENAVAQNPNSAEVLMRRAIFRQIYGMKREAAEDLKFVNRINPFIANLYGFNGAQGLLKLIDDQPVEMIQAFAPDRRIDYYYNLLDQQLSNGDMEVSELDLLEEIISEIDQYQFDDALNLIDTGLNLYPNSALVYDLRGVVFMRQNRFKEAMESFARAILLAPDFAIAWYNFARVEQLQGNNETAKVYFDKAIELQGDLTKAYFDRAILLKTQGEYAAAVTDYNRVIDLKGESYMEAFLNRGISKRMLGDFGGALIDFNSAVEAYPKNASLYKNRGNLNLVFGFYHHAIQDYTTAIQLQTDFAAAYYNRGLAHLLVHDPVSACFDLSQSADLGFEEGVEKYRYFCQE
ncbi:MAG: tetratricopeptide repeat protein [Saprospiraceae bacterium]